MKVGIPRRFDSKSAIREFIQSREFITAMKQSMNYQLFNVLNNSNNILGLINSKQQKIAKFFQKKSPLKKRATTERKVHSSTQHNQDDVRAVNNQSEMSSPRRSTMSGYKSKKKSKRQIEEEMMFEKELQEEIEKEELRREEEELEPLRKEEKLKIEEKLMEKKERLKEK